MMLSNNAADLQFPHDHLDDLESFFWVLIWITLRYEIHGTGDDTKVQETPSQRRLSRILDAFEQEPDSAAAKKYTILFSPAFPELAFGWASQFYDLVDNLLGFLKPKVEAKHTLRIRAKQAKSTGRPLPVLPSWMTDDKPLVALQEKALDDYKLFLSHVDKAILDYQTFLDNSPAGYTNATKQEPTTPKPSQSAEDNSVAQTVVPGSGSKRFRGPDVLPEDSPSAKRNRNVDFLSNRSQSPSPAPRKENGQSSRSSTSSLGK